MHEIFKFFCTSGQEESRDKFQYPLEMKADFLGKLKDNCWDILVLQRMITLLNKNKTKHDKRCAGAEVVFVL